MAKRWFLSLDRCRKSGPDRIRSGQSARQPAGRRAEVAGKCDLQREPDLGTKSAENDGEDSEVPIQDWRPARKDPPRDTFAPVPRRRVPRLLGRRTSDGLQQLALGLKGSHCPLQPDCKEASWLYCSGLRSRGCRTKVVTMSRICKTQSPSWGGAKSGRKSSLHQAGRLRSRIILLRMKQRTENCTWER